MCLRKLLANQVVMKIELKSLNEELKKITASKDNHLDIEKEDFSNLDGLFPLESENDLINIENQIQSSPTYRKKLVSKHFLVFYYLVNSLTIAPNIFLR